MDMLSLTSQEILDRISRHCPEAMWLYLQCINRCDEEGKVFFTKDMVEVQMSEDWKKFRDAIKKLARENLLEWHPFGDTITVTLAETYEDM